MSPNKERIALWESALREPGRLQTRGILERPPVEGEWIKGQCCLGVACEVAVRNGCDVSVEWVASERNGPYISYGERAGVLPEEVVDWYGLSALAGDVLLDTASSGQTLAIVMNDKEHAPFSEIADAVHQTFLSKEVK